jgi:mono/diheme cytochrome c family protein
VGADLFEINCSGCHGIKGEGIPGLAPALNDRSFFTQRLEEVGWEGTLEDYIVATVSTGRPISTRPDQYVGGGKPAMPAWSQNFGGPLRDDQVHDLATFVLNWEATALGEAEIAELPTPTPGAEEAADPVARGQQLYISGGCAGCHAIADISNGVVGPNLTQAGETAATREDGVSAEDYIRQSILNPNAVVVEGYQPSIMPQNYDQQFGDQELDDLVAFLLAQK